jgi:hypothetical protein
MFLGVKCGRCVGLISLLLSVSRLSRQCGMLNISQSYRPPRPDTLEKLTLLYFNSFVSPAYKMYMKESFNREKISQCVRI